MRIALTAGLVVGLALAAAQVVSLTKTTSAPGGEASVASETTAALAANPRGGPKLEAAILDILVTHSESQPPRLVARELLAAAAGANELQMAAIANALALRARASAEVDFPAALALWSEIARFWNPTLQRSFSKNLGRRLPGLEVPSGTDGGGLDTISPS